MRCAARVSTRRGTGRPLRPLLPLGVLLLQGCFTLGPSAANHPRVGTPFGIQLEVSHAGGQLTGELLEVREDGILLLQGQSFVYAPYERIRQARDPAGTRRSFISGGPPSAQNRERLRLQSRYPQGLSAEHLEALLARYGESEVREMGVGLGGGSEDAWSGASSGGEFAEGAAEQVLEGAVAAAAERTAEAAGGRTVEAFLAAAREGSRRYHDPGRARLDGYRPVGPDFPGMGEHWVNVGLLLEGGLDPAAPPILSYAPSPTGDRLVGVVYAVPLGPGEHAPDFPVPANQWHEHAGSIDEESLVLQHLAASAASGDAGHGGHPEATSTSTSTGTRLAVLHAWVWLENPAGVFATDNWALPYFRLDLDPPAPRTGEVEAAKMLSFASGAGAYYLAAARALARPGSEEEAALSEVFEAYRREVEEEAAAWGGGAAGAGTEAAEAALVAHLQDAWGRMWRDASARVREGTADRIRLLH
jgi:hypothetical protein